MTGARPRRQPRPERHALPGEPVIPPAPSTIDLHTHTSRSDGLLRPSQLVADAAAAGIRLLAITDHDTLAGVRDVLDAGNVPPGLELIPGIELNAITADRPDLRESEVHVLGLGVDADDDELEAALALQRRRRRHRFERMVQRLRDIARPIDDALEALPATGDDDALGRPRVARAMIAKGYVASVEEAFSVYLSRGRPAYVPREGLGPVEAIRAIRAAGGLASLAHFSEAPQRLDVIHELRDAGLGGLEVYYRTFDAATVEAVGRVAAEASLVATGGSDYHGDLEVYAATHAALWVPPTVEAPLRAALAAARSATTG
ncbi:MAG: PHP domain-containing protein [Chloroflexota bacterium]|nr:MAG: PHP domain-containing protein [Chloroflexota bacterium]